MVTELKKCVLVRDEIIEALHADLGVALQQKIYSTKSNIYDKLATIRNRIEKKKKLRVDRFAKTLYIYIYI